MARIHKTAIVSEKAVLASDVEIGPYCIVEDNVEIGAGTKLLKHCCVSGNTIIGENNIIYPFVSLGTEPQDYSFTNQKAYLKIGNGNKFREGFTANIGSSDGAATTIGNDGFFMANSHVAHDCVVGNNIVLGNCSGFAGHSHIGNNVIIAPLAGIHQFVKVGRFVIMSGGSVTSLDVPPFMIADGRNGAIKSINLIGLKRNGFSKEAIKAIRDVYKIFYRGGLNATNGLNKIKEEIEPLPEVLEFIEFVESSKRGVGCGRQTGRRA
ncbi:MAG TPA: acyl-ACP--UDP-N-acetylglucosamine O-acyltransferase [Victivallales bacterium]|nr:acyl-ACP--UDP-N-acetylglucosamine O-acyltransferase [Victivallales bacterium]